jgi:hypothetical protein
MRPSQSRSQAEPQRAHWPVNGTISARGARFCSPLPLPLSLLLAD